jgi:hypothetical protein
MDLKPKKNRPDHVTIVMIPFDQYSIFAKAVRNLIQLTKEPFELILIEGNAPHSVRLDLEALKRKHKNIKIIYSNHRPRMAEAFNLALPHIRTERAFFMHNDVQVKLGWLNAILSFSDRNKGVVCPKIEVLHKDKYLDPYMGYPATYSSLSNFEVLGVNMHAFLLDKDIIDHIETFDEKVGTALVGLELTELMKKHSIAIHQAPITLHYEPPALARSHDLALFAHQWDEAHMRESLTYLKKKWGLDIPEKKYLGWLNRKKALCEKKPFFLLPSLEKTSPFLLRAPKINLRNFIDVLNQA